MKKLLPLTTLLCITLYACKKDNDERLDLHGVFTETAPVTGRSQLQFTSGNLVIRMEQGSAMKDTFHYALSNGKIMLIPAWTNQYPAVEFEFKVLDKTTFEIENLYPQIPESSKTYITYKK